MRWRDEVAAVEVVVRLLADTAGRQVSHATVAGGCRRLLDARVVQVEAIVGVGRSRCRKGHEVLGSGRERRTGSTKVCDSGRRSAELR
jgi:ribosomal protein L19E